MRTRTNRVARARSRRDRRGVTLVELVVVLVILATIAGLALTVVAPASVDARETATRVTLTNVRSAIDGPYRLNVGRVPDRVSDLLVKPDASWPPYDPESQTGWNGPYVRVPTARYAVGPVGEPGSPGYVHGSFTSEYGQTGDLAILDAYGQPIVLQVPDLDGVAGAPTDEERRHARLVSGGPNGEIDTPRITDPLDDARFPRLSACEDDLVLYVTVADQREP